LRLKASICLASALSSPAFAEPNDHVLRSFGVGAEVEKVGVVENAAARDNPNEAYAGDRGETEFK